MVSYTGRQTCITFVILNLGNVEQFIVQRERVTYTNTPTIQFYSWIIF